MRNRVFGITFLCAFFAIFLAIAPSLSAFGRRDITPVPVPVNPEYVLLITAIDVSGLPLARQLMGETVVRNLANSLENINFRFRQEEEITYYRDFAWENARATAARALQSRRGDRDRLLFRGDPPWRYRRDLRTIDASIAELEQRLAEIYATAPVVEAQPVFRLSETNRAGNFPRPPNPGEELRFTRTHRVDAFLVGRLSEFHGRIYLQARVFTLHSRSFSYEYSVLFSSADLFSAIDEITFNLVTAVSGTLPAGLIVRANPPDAVVLIDGTFVGRGEMDLHTHFPGEVEIEVWAHNYAPATFPLTLNPGELAEIFIDLTPLSLSYFEVTVPDSPGSHVYKGALFVGETPLALRLPRGQFTYISVETPEGEIGTFIYMENDLLGGNARFVRGHDTPGMGGTAIVDTRVPIHPEDGRVERARRGFYRAFGALWIILPASLLTAGVANTHIQAYNNVLLTGQFPGDPETLTRLYNSAVRATNVRAAAFGVMGVSLGVTFFQIFRYLRAASTDATPIVRALPPPPPEEDYNDYLFWEDPQYDEHTHEPVVYEQYADESAEEYTEITGQP